MKLFEIFELDFRKELFLGQYLDCRFHLLIVLLWNLTANLTIRLGQAIGFERRFQQCFNYIVSVRIVGGENPTHFEDTDKLYNIMS